MIKSLDEYIEYCKEMEVFQSFLDKKDGTYISLLCRELQEEYHNLGQWLEELRNRRKKEEMAAEHKDKRTYSLRVLNKLMKSDKPITTNEICEMLGCDRKTVYTIISSLEISGFGIEVIRGQHSNSYCYKGLYGNSED